MISSDILTRDRDTGRQTNREKEREREFYSQLHCRHTRRAINPSKLAPILSNTYNEQYTKKENIHRQRRTDRLGNSITSIFLSVHFNGHFQVDLG